MNAPLASSIQATTALLTVRALSKRFGDVQAVAEAGFSVAPGEIFALIGPSGCGKSTTLRMIAGFERPDGGEILLGGRRIEAEPPEKRGVGIVFQDYALFPHLSVLDNVAFALARLPREERHAKARRFIAMVGLEGLDARFPDQLSGGQQQRVALARALCAEPRLILLDEPFSNLDASLRAATRREIRGLLKETGIGAVFVTHDQEEALSFADRLCVMKNGVVQQVGEPERVYYRPCNAFVAGFLGRTNILSGRVAAGASTADTPIGPVALDRPASGEVLLSIRPEHLALEPAAPGCPIARVAEREFKGHDMTLWIECGGSQVQMDTDFTCPFRPGDSVRLVARSAATVLSD
ncbi:ABC transporter ATP-binding protein [Antarcticirhabdus aurantiaca]|uniref:ABC transporter ATP-binding protein n=1 Tax=Antarcticirhabdus aurantiaca TaxID=2606717 RepID=A0ACD4NTH7_9HYPH|nr:ABC transporter ATP-binding protein [Antarcticirhabdus aurantiaca]WAJ30211.1 ABC transporter ATP-binding protein [Jeongeuplla avenae]